MSWIEYILIATIPAVAGAIFVLTCFSVWDRRNRW